MIKVQVRELNNELLNDKTLPVHFNHNLAASHVAARPAESADAQSVKR